MPQMNYFKVGTYIRKHDRLLIASIPNIFWIKKKQLLYIL